MQNYLAGAGPISGPDYASPEIGPVIGGCLDAPSVVAFTVSFFIVFLLPTLAKSTA